MLFKSSIKFPDIFNIYTGNSETDTEYSSINRCIGLILTTAKGELLGDPDFGCTLYEKIMEPVSEDLTDSIKYDIIEALDKYEKRIAPLNKHDIIIKAVDGTRIKYTITINYTVLKSSQYNSMTINLDGQERI